MKNVIILVVAICISGCESPHSVDNVKKSFFDPKNLPELSLENVSDFWVNDSFEPYNSYFDYFSGYIAGKGLKNEIQGISVAIFESKEIALESMEIRIRIVAGTINKGSANDSNDIWWYGDGVVFRNQYNTIIDVFYHCTDYNVIEPVLLSTSNTVANEIVNLSD